MGFFKTLFSVCKGTEVFPKLLDVPFPKAMLHFFLIVLITSLFISAMRSADIFRDAKEIASALKSEFGGLKYNGDHLEPLKDPLSIRSVAPAGLSIDYIGSSPKLPPNVMTEDSDAGIIWAARSVSAYIRVAADLFIWLPVVYPENAKVPLKPVSRAAAESLISSNTAENSALTNMPSVSSPNNVVSGPNASIIFKMISSVLLFDYAYFSSKQDDSPLHAPDFISQLSITDISMFFLIFAGYLLKVLGSAIMFIVVFTAVYSFMVRGPDTKLSLKSMFIISLYAAFPPMIIASFFPALGLPYLDYQTVFLFSFLTYLFVVFNKVQKTLNPPDEKDEIDF